MLNRMILLVDDALAVRGLARRVLEGEELVPGSTFIQKPFSPVELGMKVRTLLEPIGG